jgi:fumarate reductase subunit C
VLFHAITWFNLTPKAMVLRLSGKRVADWVILGLNYAAWLLLSGAVAFILLRG